MLASPSGYQTVSMLDGGHTGLYYDAAEDLLTGMPGVDSVVLLGLGGGEMLHGAHRAQPAARLTGIDIDARTVELAGSDFGAWPSGTTFVRADALAWIGEQAPRSIAVLMVDLYDDSRMVPASTHAEFFADCARALKPNGLYIQNVYPAAFADGIENRLQPFFVTAQMRYGNNVVITGLRRP